MRFFNYSMQELFSRFARLGSWRAAGVGHVGVARQPPPAELVHPVDGSRGPQPRVEGVRVGEHPRTEQLIRIRPGRRPKTATLRCYGPAWILPNGRGPDF